MNKEPKNIYFFYSLPQGVSLTLPQGVMAFHTIKANSLDEVLPKLQGRTFQLIGTNTVDNFLKDLKISTITLSEAPKEDIIKVDEPELSKEKQLEAMALYLQDNGYEITKH